jgi:phosphate-selective porin OprO and OprP
MLATAVPILAGLLLAAAAPGERPSSGASEESSGAEPASSAQSAATDEAKTAGEQEGSAFDDPVESDIAEPPDRRVVKGWNQYDFGFTTFNWGIYTNLDFGNAAQDETAREQVEVNQDAKLRDFRFSFKGRFNLERSITWTAGLMYDAPTDSWFPRETGIQVAFPRLWGALFVGRQKEGISLNKITVGYAVWAMERAPMNDATIPIMNDGIKWFGVTPNERANWNVGYFHNVLPKTPATGWYDDAFVARFAWLPVYSGARAEGSLLHLALAYHYGKYADGEAQLRARPQSSTAPYFLDTGTFPADHDDLVGLEAYYRRNNWMVGSEYLIDSVSSPETGNPVFHGGEVFVSWIATGEIRPYIPQGGKMDFVFPKRSAFEGGMGAVEPVLQVSYTDLDDGTLQGGRFWRITPHINWYLDDMVRLEAAYGLGILDRSGSTGLTHFFQARIQFQVQ